MVAAVLRRREPTTLEVRRLDRLHLPDPFMVKIASGSAHA